MGGAQELLGGVPGPRRSAYWPIFNSAASSERNQEHLREAATWFGPFHVQMLWPADADPDEEWNWKTVAVRQRYMGGTKEGAFGALKRLDHEDRVHRYRAINPFGIVVKDTRDG